MYEKQCKDCCRVGVIHFNFECVSSTQHTSAFNGFIFCSNLFTAHFSVCVSVCPACQIEFQHFHFSLRTQLKMLLHKVCYRTTWSRVNLQGLRGDGRFMTVGLLKLLPFQMFTHNMQNKRSASHCVPGTIGCSRTWGGELPVELCSAINN